MLMLLVAIVLTALTTALYMYIKVVNPLAFYAQCCKLDTDLAQRKLADNQRLTSDILKWVEIETHRYKPEILEAVRQRITERLEQ